MTFDDLRIKVGRRPITVVEIDLDSCANVYGIAPCAAAIGVTGAAKCFNTYGTCQDTAHFSRVTKTLRFTSESSFLPIGETIYPCITSVDIAPTQIDPKGFSVSASASIELRDFPHHDRGIDPYTASRIYDPSLQGTFFGKLRSRNPYLENRPMRISEGYVDENRVIYTRTHNLFIDRMEGPDANGRVKLVGKDALRFADNAKSKAPAVSKGSLLDDIDAAVTTIVLTPTGVGAAYPPTGTVRVDDELMTYTSVTGDTLNGLSRGSDGTVAEEHDAASKVQLCLRYNGASVPTIIYDLFATYSGFNPAYLPLVDWEDEATTWLGGFVLNVIISEPTGVRELLTEIQESTGSYIWWDDIAAQVRFKVLTPPLPSSPPPMLNDLDNFLAGSFTVRDMGAERVSQVVLYYLPNGSIFEMKPSDFRSVSILVDTTGEGVNAYGTSLGRTILSRWVPSQPIAEEVAARILSRFKDIPRQVTFQLDAKDAALNTGDLVDISSRLIQGVDGAPRLIRCLVTECREIVASTHYEYTAREAGGTEGSATLIAPDGTPDWPLATQEQRSTYMFISDDAGLMSDGAPGPTIT